MSNLKSDFPVRLSGMSHTTAKNGDHVYTASFEDGTSAVVRRGGRTYVSVAQVGTLGKRTDFIFSAKAVPSISRYQQDTHIVTVPISEALS